MNLAERLFDLKHSKAGEYIGRYTYPWLILPCLGEVIEETILTLDRREYFNPFAGVYVHKTAVVSPTAFIGKGCIIGKNTEIRHGAFIRGNVFIGEDCVIGNSTEVKNSVIFDGVQIPHYNYVGDSILGYKAHLGAGVIISNVKSDKSNVAVCFENRLITTGMRKLGAMVGDFAEIGCSSVLNPGTVIMRNSSVYPLTSVRGFVSENSIMKAPNLIIRKY